MRLTNILLLICSVQTYLRHCYSIKFIEIPEFDKIGIKHNVEKIKLEKNIETEVARKSINHEQMKGESVDLVNTAIADINAEKKTQTKDQKSRLEYGNNIRNNPKEETITEIQEKTLSIKTQLINSRKKLPNVFTEAIDESKISGKLYKPHLQKVHVRDNTTRIKYPTKAIKVEYYGFLPTTLSQKNIHRRKSNFRRRKTRRTYSSYPPTRTFSDENQNYRRNWHVSGPKLRQDSRPTAMDKDESIKSKIQMLVEQTLHDTQIKMHSIQKLQDKFHDASACRIGFILSMIKKTRDVLNELFNVAVKHRDEWIALEQLKIFELIVHTNVDITNLIRNLVEVHVHGENTTLLRHKRVFRNGPKDLVKRLNNNLGRN